MVYVEMYKEMDRKKEREQKKNKSVLLLLTLTFDLISDLETNSCPLLVDNQRCSVLIPPSVLTLNTCLV